MSQEGFQEILAQNHSFLSSRKKFQNFESQHVLFFNLEKPIFLSVEDMLNFPIMGIIQFVYYYHILLK